MKKILLSILCCLLLASCVSTSIEYYSTPVLDSNKIYIQLDQSTTTVSTGGALYTNSYGWTYVPPTSENAKLSTIRNLEKIKEILASKGYQVVSSIDEADIIMVGESKSDSGSSVVTLGFYAKKTNQLMFICEGEYGYGFGIQSDLDNAILKALESVPAISR